jgi:hypothetical protein
MLDSRRWQLQPLLPDDLQVRHGEPAGIGSMNLFGQCLLIEFAVSLYAATSATSIFGDAIYRNHRLSAFYMESNERVRAC